jgi:predicted metal-binding protein
MLNQKHTLFVCTTCGSKWEDGKRVGKSSGEKLLEQLQQLAQDSEIHNKFCIQGVECMSACSHSCVIALIAEGKSTYLFGDLPVDGSTSAILECATKYYSQADGSLPWSERPEPLKKGILAKIPALNKWAQLNITCS